MAHNVCVSSVVRFRSRVLSPTQNVERRHKLWATPHRTIEETFSQTETLKILRQRLEKLYNCIANDQIIHIYNLENIKLSSVTHNIKHKIDTLFFEARIPQTWKIDIKWTITPVLIVHVRMLNYLVKEKTKELLTSYFSTNYHNDSIY